MLLRTHHDSPSDEPVICIVGPTASGKTDVAQTVAQALDGEVVSADSMQIYTGMDIGTGKLPLSQRRVPHHGFDLVSPGEPYSAALFQSFARRCFDDIRARGRRALLCGGTGFYVRAAIDDYRFPAGEQKDNPLREALGRIAEDKGAQALWEMLQEKDSRSAQVVSPNDVKRVIRALEMYEEGVSYADQKEQLASISQVIPAQFFGLSVDPDILRRRIDKRVDAMVEQGLVAEVTSLLNAGLRDGLTAPQAIGYKEIVAALDGRCTLEEAVEAIKIATHRYAKRQRTWFRKDRRIVWIDADDGDGDRIASAIIDVLMR